MEATIIRASNQGKLAPIHEACKGRGPQVSLLPHGFQAGKQASKHEARTRQCNQAGVLVLAAGSAFEQVWCGHRRSSTDGVTEGKALMWAHRRRNTDVEQLLKDIAGITTCLQGQSSGHHTHPTLPVSVSCRSAALPLSVRPAAQPLALAQWALRSYKPVREHNYCTQD
eukprot:1142123-Pelagomonas_calceolata.AAC.5